MLAIFKRELQAYFTGPIGYIFCAIFIFLSNLFFYFDNLQFYTSDFTHIFNLMMLYLIVLIPLMTMRLWSEEKRQRTDQLLLTAPVSTTGVVLGKFFAALAVFLISLSLTLVYPIVVAAAGTLPTAKIIGNYIAIIFAASAYIAISLFFSSLTKSQIISAILSIVALALFWLANLLFTSTSIPWIAAVMEFFSMITRYFNFFRGIFTLADVVYFLSITGIFLFLTSRVIEKQRWS
ncbi:MAG: ABC transporter [Oscillospiraceae bacterium]|nr:ABC transporter [Oscillospiraceae bacterium]